VPPVEDGGSGPVAGCRCRDHPPDAALRSGRL